MATFVLIPGMCHGAWWYEPLAQRLEAAGHRAVGVTPVGLGPEGLSDAVNLTTHIDQTTHLAESLDAEDLVLVGHSWGGMVTSGVADRIAAKCTGLVYVDAFVPDDGDSAWTVTNDEERAWFADAVRADGLTVPPLPTFDDRAMPHPIASVLQRIELTGAWRDVPVKHFVEATDWPFASPIAATSAKVKADGTFSHHVWDTRHNVMHDGPDRLLELLLAVADETARVQSA